MLNYLFVYAFLGDCEAIETLLKENVDINVVDKKRSTALIVVTHMGKIEAVKLLLKK